MRGTKKFLGVGLFLILCSSVWAAVPKLMNYQALLTDDNNNPVRNQTLNIKFTIYDDSTGGSIKWTETLSVTTNNDGAYNALLGSVTAISDAVFNDTLRWLGIKVASDPEMTPRIRLASTGYAYRVNSVNGAKGGSITGNLELLDAGSLKSFLYGTGQGRLLLWDFSGDMTVDLNAGAISGGQLVLSQEDGSSGVLLDGGSTSLGSALTMRNGPGNATFTLDADHTTVVGDVGAFLSMTDGTNTTVHLDASGVSGGAQFSLMDVEGFTTISLDAESGTDGGANLVLTDGSTNTSAANRIILDANSGAAGGALITLKDATGTDQIFLDANWASSGRSRIVVDEVQINGADLSEQFDVKAVSGSIESGMVVCIDPEHSGELLISNQAYDRKVAGIISGAGGIYPGMLMGQSGSMADGKYPIALTGRVYCWVDASNEPIQPGDLLTTSDILGHAMKATDYNKAQGAIIGKAMTGLEKGRGLVLVLVSLQ